MTLQPEQRVEHDGEDGAEDEDGLRVALPVLVALGVDAEQAVEAALGNAEEAQPAAGGETSSV